MSQVERSEFNEELVIQSIGGDLRVRGYGGNGLRIEGESLVLANETPLEVTCGGDCDIQVTEQAVVTVHQVSGDAKITNLANQLVVNNVEGDLIVRHIINPVTVRNTQGDFVAKHVEGNLTVQNVVGDAQIQHVTGDVTIENIGNDLEIRDVDGACICNNVNGDLEIRMEFHPGQTYRFGAMGDIDCVVNRDNPVTFHVMSGIELAIDSDELEATIETEGGIQHIRIGEGGADVYIQACDTFTLTNNEANYGGGFNFDFQVNLDEQMQELNRKINERLSGLGQIIDATTQQALEQVSRRFRGRNFEEDIQRHTERAARMAERHAERAHRHTERMQRFSKRRREPDADPWEPATSQERLLILKLVEEGKITVEEADKLLQTIEGK